MAGDEFGGDRLLRLVHPGAREGQGSIRSRSRAPLDGIDFGGNGTI